jgi:hypothetical protein
VVDLVDDLHGLRHVQFLVELGVELPADLVHLVIQVVVDALATSVELAHLLL